MVTASGTVGEADGIHRPYEYAKFRNDKAASEGYSSELISNLV